MDAKYYDHARVAKLRKDAGLTQQQLAEELGVTSVTISRVETGVAVSPLLLARIAQRLGHNLTDLLYDQPLAATQNIPART
ncbi:MAG TPA: helix-turn-helix transcriptional regulator [Pyrinomonadaceae bacterium]|jgi:transcriptional regulator with XRE-family HTH domain